MVLRLLFRTKYTAMGAVGVLVLFVLLAGGLVFGVFAGRHSLDHSTIRIV